MTEKALLTPEVFAGDFEPEVNTCTRCWGSGWVVACVDDMCHGLGECIHGDNVLCPDCDGDGEIA